MGMDIDKVATKLKMVGQTVVEANPFGIAVKAAGGNQNIFRIYKHNSTDGTTSQLPDYYMDFTMSERFIFAQKLVPNENNPGTPMRIREALYVEPTNNDLLGKYKAHRVNTVPNGKLTVVRVSSLTVNVLINYKGKKLNLRTLEEQIYPTINKSRRTNNLGLEAALEVSTGRIIFYKYSFIDSYNLYRDVFKGVLAISDEEFSFVKILPKPERIDTSRYDDDSLVVF